MRDMKQSKRGGGERGSTLIVGIASLVFIIVPMSGLAVDVGIIYAVRSRLQASVDGAALAAARALVLGQTITSQESTARQNAVNWFYANFPSGTWATTGTVMGTSNVVIDDNSVPNLAKIQITATTVVPTWFLKYLSFNSTNLGVIGQASRRDVVAMMVLDRSGSMNSTAGACASLISSGKIFTGQFAPGRDRIGLISFSDNVYIHSAPSTSFQATLGYTASYGSGTGELDTITCAGGTSTPMALSWGFNEIYQLNLPGAFNTLLLETDGLPNTLLQNSYNSAANTVNLSATSTCVDKNNKTYKPVGANPGGGFNNAASIPAWTTTAPAGGMGAGSYNWAGAPGGVIPTGMVHQIYSSDPNQTDSGQTHYFYMTFGPYYSNPTKYNNSVFLTNTTAKGCIFDAAPQTVFSPYSGTDFAYFPSTDVFGNQLLPSNHAAYQTAITTSGGNITVNWQNYHNGALNATDDIAYRMRTDPTIPTTVYAIGLGGNTGSGSSPPDTILLQRVANDPNADLFWSSPETGPQYPACSTEPTCITYTSGANAQPQGVFAFSFNQAQLAAAFRSIASQVLRLSE